MNVYCLKCDRLMVPNDNMHTCLGCEGRVRVEPDNSLFNGDTAWVAHFKLTTKDYWKDEE